MTVRRYLPRELRIKLYNEALELRKQGLSYNRIINVIEEKYGIRLNKSNVSFWCRGFHSPYNGIRIPSIDFLKPSPELSYVIGVVCGDGYVHRKRKRHKGYNDTMVSLKVKDMEFAQRFAECLGKVLNRETPRLKPTRYGFFKVIVNSRTLYDLLQKPIDTNKIRPFIEHCDECITSFLRGFFDSEGCVERDGSIKVHNTDIQLLTYIQRLLDSLTIQTTGIRLCKKENTPFFDRRIQKTYLTKKSVHYIHIRANSRLKFYQSIGFTIKRACLKIGKLFGDYKYACMVLRFMP